MKTMVHEIGVFDIQGNKHPVRFKKGLNVVTGKSSTGKSALIEIFEYCFGSSENTIPKGIITDYADIYYVAISVNDQSIVVARDPKLSTKGFSRRLDEFEPSIIRRNYFEKKYFRPLEDYKKYLREFFVDIDDVDESLAARANRRYNSKAATPSIRSFSSFILQHQNLVANKHALFYRFDEKEKRDQAIDHTKIFLGLVDQKYFHLSQEQERLLSEMNRLKRLKETAKRASDKYKEKIGPVLLQLYAMMGFKDIPLSLNTILHNPQDAKNQLDKILIPEEIDHNSDAITLRYNQLKLERTQKTTALRKLQRQVASITKHIHEEEQFIENIKAFSSPEQVQVSASACPFCHTEKESLPDSAVKLKQAISRLSGNLAQARPMRAKFESSLIDIKRRIEELEKEITYLGYQISDIENTEDQISKNKSLYENILMQKAKLFMLIDTLDLADDIDLESEIQSLNKKLTTIKESLNNYDVTKSLELAAKKVNKYMNEIGHRLDFEQSYLPINLHFSFETFDLYHLQGDEKIYLRSMGSGANWLYSHITLFLALHKYFTELGDKCAIPSLIFFDQPTQVYFPNFNRDNSLSFDEQKNREAEQRKQLNIKQGIDEDIKAVENLFSQLSIYCNAVEKENGFCPQIIVTDHADNLSLTNGVLFDSLVNGNRWRERGLIHPVPEV